MRADSDRFPQRIFQKLERVMKKLVFALLMLIGCSSPIAPRENLWVEYTSMRAYVIIHKESCRANPHTHDHNMNTTDCAVVKKAFEVDLNGAAGACPICKPCQ